MEAGVGNFIDKWDHGKPIPYSEERTPGPRQKVVALVKSKSIVRDAQATGTRWAHVCHCPSMPFFNNQSVTVINSTTVNAPAPRGIGKQEEEEEEKKKDKRVSYGEVAVLGVLVFGVVFSSLYVFARLGEDVSLDRELARRDQKGKALRQDNHGHPHIGPVLLEIKNCREMMAKRLKFDTMLCIFVAATATAVAAHGYDRLVQRSLIAHRTVVGSMLTMPVAGAFIVWHRPRGEWYVQLEKQLERGQKARQSERNPTAHNPETAAEPSAPR